MKKVLQKIGAAITVYLILVIFFSWYEDLLIYHPTDHNYQSIVHLDLEEHNVSSSSGDSIHLVYKEQSRDLVFLFFHGNAGNITANLGNLEALEATGYSYAMLDYPGYGKSSGSPNEQDIYAAGQASYDFLINEKGFTADQIILDGQSLGGAVAIELARKNEARSVILESPFTSTHGMAKVLLPFMPVQLFTSNKYDSLSKIAQVNIPLLIIHGEADRTIPAKQSRLLYAAAKEPRYLILLPQVDHNVAFVNEPGKHQEAIAEFIEHSHIPESFFD